MAVKKKGQTYFFSNPPGIVTASSAAGCEEGKGSFGSEFDIVSYDNKFGEDTWEKAEKKMVQDTIGYALNKSGVSTSDLDLIIGGDLLNQIITSSYTARDYSVPFLGIYGACSSMIEALLLGSVMMDGGYADSVLAFSSSHYQTAERQYRTPLEYGDQYPPYKQWTVTGAGIYILGWLNAKTIITHGTVGKIIDPGIKDANNMGGAMAASAADSILQHFQDTSRGIEDYDLIITGDLGKTGKEVMMALLSEKNINDKNKFFDCGDEIYNHDKRYGAGGSGCAASAILLAGHFIPRLISEELNRIMVIGTGALLSPLSVLQGESIPGIAHIVVIEKMR